MRSKRSLSWPRAVAFKIKWTNPILRGSMTKKEEAISTTKGLSLSNKISSWGKTRRLESSKKNNFSKPANPNIRQKKNKQNLRLMKKSQSLPKKKKLSPPSLQFQKCQLNKQLSWGNKDYHHFPNTISELDSK